MKSKRAVLGAAAPWLTVALLMPSAVFATDEAAPPTDRDTREIEEIVVTAQKRVESVQEVPSAITALSAAQMATLALDDAASLASYVPNLQANGAVGAGTPIFSLRGVSMTDPSLNQSSPVAIYVDEVYKGNFALLGVQMYDLERVEVLRGPQGTLYGKNTTGGAINFVTRRPEFDTSGYLTAGIGNYNRTELEGAVGGPLVDERLAGRLAFTYAKADGWYENLLPGEPDMEGTDDLGVRGSLLFKPTDALDLMLRVSHSDQHPYNYGVYGRPLPTGTGGGVYSLFNSLDPVANPQTDYFRTGLSTREIESDYNRRRSIESNAAALTVDWRFSDRFTLTSITSWDDGQLFSPEDTDGSPLQVIRVDYEASDVQQFTQDLRITSTMGGRLEFIGGLYYSHDELMSATDMRFYNDVDLNLDGALDYLDCVSSVETIYNADPADDLFPIGCNASNSFRQSRDSAAVYVDGSYALTEPLKLRFGLRITHDRASVRDYNAQLLGSDGVPLANLIPGDPVDLNAGMGDDFSNDEPTGRIGLDYTTRGGTLWYGSFSRGYRSGAFNGQAFFSPEELTVAKPETLGAFEVGFKTELASGRAQFNGALFEYQYRDQQFLDIDPNTALQLLVNVPKSRIRGAELEFVVVPVERLTINGGLGWLDTKVEEGTLRGENIEGNELSMAPHLTASLAADWTIPIAADLELALHADGNYVSDHYFGAMNLERIANDARTVMNARVAIHPRGERWEVALWGRNLTDELYYTSAADLSSFGFDYFHLNPPRTYGAQATWNF